MTGTAPHIDHLNPRELLGFDGISQIVRARRGSMVFIAGQSAFNPQFQLCGGSDFKAQAIAALNNVETAVKAVGGQAADIVSSTVYIKGLSSTRSGLFFEAMASALNGLEFPVHAISVIGVQELGAPEQLIEIVSIAVLDT